jgi:hypothetical protein
MICIIKIKIVYKYLPLDSRVLLVEGSAAAADACGKSISAGGKDSGSSMLAGLSSL